MLLKEIVAQRFTGSITLNFFQGGITNIVKQESIKI